MPKLHTRQKRKLGRGKGTSFKMRFKSKGIFAKHRPKTFASEEGAKKYAAEKGIKELIYSFKLSNLRDFKLKIIGDGPDLKKLKYKYSSENIEFYGMLSNSETLEIISNSKAVVTATKLFEGQPTLLCEASSMAIPSIFPKTGGIGEFFPENYELSFEQFNYNDLVQKLNLLIDTNYILDIGQKNKEYISQYLNEHRLLQNIKSALNE